LSFQHWRDPAKQVYPDFVAVDLIEHFMSSTGTEIVGNTIDARCMVALYQDLDWFKGARSRRTQRWLTQLSLSRRIAKSTIRLHSTRDCPTIRGAIHIDVEFTQRKPRCFVPV